MGIFSGSKDQGTLVAAFDIGSASVGVALFYANKNKTPNIVFSTRELIALEADFNFENFIASTMKSLDAVAGRAALAGFGAPRKFYAVLSSPWEISQTRVVRLEKNAPFVFTSKLADSLIQKEISSFHEEHLEKYKSTGSKVVPIELKNMKTVLNGYHSQDPINKKVKELEMTFLFSMSSEQFIQDVQDIVFKHFHSRADVKFSSFTMATFAVVRDFFADQNNFLLIKIGGEVTDIAMVKDDVLCNSISFPLGVNFMAREISKSMNSSLEEAKSLISLYKEGHASALTEDALRPAITKIKNEWLSKLQVSLSTLSNDISIPATIFLSVGGDYVGFFTDLIKKEQFSQYTLTESKFQIRFLGTEELHGAVTLGKNVIHDPLLAIESIYINRFLR